MRKLRKIDRGKRKRERREAEEKLATQASLLMKHPTECCVCTQAFKRTHETVKTWHVTVVEERVRLTCPKCWGVISEVLKNPDVKNS